MTHSSLFSGIGGFDLAASWAGIENVFQVEIDDFCQKVLEKNFPDTKKYLDIKEFDGKEYAGRIDIISGGFPCQPFSVAGKRKGSSDDRFLWGEMLRVISEIQPTWVIAENVYGITSIESGLVFEQILADLGSKGYEIQPFIVPAISKNAPHKRNRIWIVANNDSKRQLQQERIEQNIRERDSDNSIKYGIANNDGTPTEYSLQTRRNEFTGETEFNSNTMLTKSQVSRRTWTGWKESSNNAFDRNWFEVATELCRVDDGIPNRMDRIKALGNAIVPQVAYEIFKTIKDISINKYRGTYD